MKKPTSKLTDSVVVKEANMSGNIGGSPMVKLPDEMVPCLLHKVGNADVLGSLLLWVKLFPPPGLLKSSERGRE